MQATVVIHVSGPDATAVRFVLGGTFQAPVPKDTVFGHIEIDPVGWTGNLTVSGPDASLIGLNAKMEVVALAELEDARDYTITVDASN